MAGVGPMNVTTDDMNNPIDPGMCHRVKVFSRPPLTAVLSKSQLRIGDLEIPLVVHVYSSTVQQPILTVACTRHAMQHDKQKCVIRVFGRNGKAEEVPSNTTIADFAERALNIIRSQLELGAPEQGGATIRLLQSLQLSSLVLSMIVTAAAVGFVAYQIWKRPTSLLESKNPGMVAAWLLPGAAIFAIAAWAKAKIEEVRNARL